MPQCAQCGYELPEGASCPQCQQASAPPGSSHSQAASFSRFPLTNLLLALNIGVFAAMVATGVSPSEPTIAQLLRWGANWGPLTLGRQPWRLVSCAFVHVGVVHIAFNMWCFWNIGRMAENIFGSVRLLAIYLLTGISSSLLSLFVHPFEVSAGASGAIFGVAGALIPALYFGKLPAPRSAINATLRSLVLFAFYNLMIGAVVPHIDNAGHIGGFGFGLLIGLLLSPKLLAAREERGEHARRVFLLMAVLLLSAGWYVKRARSVVAPLRHAEVLSVPSRFANL